MSKKYENWNFGYTSKYDLSNDNTEQITEELAIDYTEEYMFQNCLNIKLSLKNNGGSVDRDLKPENSIYLTFSFRNLGEIITIKDGAGQIMDAVEFKDGKKPWINHLVLTKQL